MASPTISPLKQSSTADTYSLPSEQGTSVILDSHFWLGADAVKSLWINFDGPTIPSFTNVSIELACPYFFRSFAKKTECILEDFIGSAQLADFSFQFDFTCSFFGSFICASAPDKLTVTIFVFANPAK
jgi:hypothetical protein